MGSTRAGSCTHPPCRSVSPATETSGHPSPSCHTLARQHGGAQQRQGGDGVPRRGPCGHTPSHGSTFPMGGPSVCSPHGHPDSSWGCWNKFLWCHIPLTLGLGRGAEPPKPPGMGGRAGSLGWQCLDAASAQPSQMAMTSSAAVREKAGPPIILPACPGKGPQGRQPPGPGSSRSRRPGPAGYCEEAVGSQDRTGPQEHLSLHCP